MKVMVVPVLSDNYSYLLIDEQLGEAAAVDPAEPTKVLDAAKQAGVRITAVFTTHYHRDHAGGNEGMQKALPGVPIYGGTLDKVSACTHPLSPNELIEFTENINVKALHTPCHTKGHMCFYAMASSGQKDPIVFTGDTLFVSGCGRFFEGTALDMYASLCRTLQALPPATRIYCGHEYTVRNLEFALSVEPKNYHADEKLAWAKLRRAKGLPTVPSTLLEELNYNPFMRCETPSIQAATGKDNPVDALAELRLRKDYF